MMNEVLFSIDRVTGFVSAAFLFGVLVGFIRAAVGNEGPRLRSLAVGLCLFSALAITECIRVRPDDNWADALRIYGRLAGIVFNLLSLFAAYCCLRFLWLAIPEKVNGRPERENWNWYTAPLYPPWGFPGDWRAFMDDVAATIRRHKK